MWRGLERRRMCENEYEGEVGVFEEEYKRGRVREKNYICWMFEEKCGERVCEEKCDRGKVWEEEDDGGGGCLKRI